MIREEQIESPDKPRADEAPGVHVDHEEAYFMLSYFSLLKVMLVLLRLGLLYDFDVCWGVSSDGLIGSRNHRSSKLLGLEHVDSFPRLQACALPSRGLG